MPGYSDGIPYAVAADAVAVWPQTSRELADVLSQRLRAVKVDDIAGLRDLINKLGAIPGTPQASQTSAILQRLTSLESKVTAQPADTGWRTVTIAAGFEAQGGEPFQVRKIGTRVAMRWGVGPKGISASSTYTVATLDAAFRPSRSVYVPIASSNANATALGVVFTDGTVQVRTASSAGSYYLFDAISYYTD